MHFIGCFNWLNELITIYDQNSLCLNYKSKNWTFPLNIYVTQQSIYRTLLKMYSFFASLVKDF